MREDYEERRFNPLKIGVIGALIIAAVVGSMIFYQSRSDEKAAVAKQQADLQQQIDKLNTANEDLKNKLGDAEKHVEDLQNRLSTRESQLASLKNQSSSAISDSAARLKATQEKAGKDQEQLQAQMAQLKKTSDQQIKQLQDQLSKSQSDLQQARLEAQRSLNNAKVLQTKLNAVNQGDDDATNQIVQQLSDARKQLKLEQEQRKKLEAQLQELKTAPPQ